MSLLTLNEKYLFYDNIPIYTINQFPFQDIKRRGFQQKKRGTYDVGHNDKHIRYMNIITAFDIETTRIPEIEQSIMYIWQWYFDSIGVCIGRTWDELLLFMHRIDAELPKDRMIVVFDHNLSYEFQFLAGIYNFHESEVFCTDARKVLYCKMFNRFQFRCSMMHANSGLSTYLKDYGAKHTKLEMNYNVQRYPWTKLTDDELGYCVVDVIGLVEAINNDLIINKDDLYTFPLTSTGNVRRIAKREMQHAKEFFVKPVLPDLHIHTLLREGFRGGNVHANRLCTGLLLDNVSSMDESSAYIYAMMCNRVPIGKFFPVENTVENVEKWIYQNDHAAIFRVKFYNIRLKHHWEPVPYLSRDKAFYCDDESFVNDNGRMISCNYIMTTLTDVDYKIVKKMYEYDRCEIVEAYAAKYGYLPNKIRELLKVLYTKKTALKNVEGSEIEYSLAKALLNSCYGMMVQNPIRAMTVYRNGEFIDDMSKSFAELYDTYCKNAWSCYQWGCWITANSRNNLQIGIDHINKTKGAQFVYCDTDSVKYRGNVDFSKINDARIKACMRCGAYASDSKGNIHYMGVFENEGTYEHFKTLGAKKYVYNYPGKDMIITIAGVNKKLGAEELMDNGGYDAFNPSFTFYKGGGTESIYNDENFGEYIIDGHKINITRNVVIRDSTYRLNITETYRRLLNSLDTITGREQYAENIKRLQTLDIYES